MTMPDTDLLGKLLSEEEQEMLKVYVALKDLCAREGLPPCAARNIRAALSSMWQATNDLGLQFEQLYEYGV